MTDYPAILRQGKLVAFAFPLGTSYYRHGYWIYRALLAHLLPMVLPKPVIQTSAPLSTEVAVTYQAPHNDQPARWMVHIINFSPNRRTPEHCEYAEDPIPLRDVQIQLQVAGPFTRAYLAHDGAPLPLTHTDGGWKVTVSEIPISAIVVYE